MGSAWQALIVMLAACGRIGFDETGVGPPADAPPAPVCPTFATFCDSFESGDISRWDDSLVSSTASLAATSSTVHSGTFALDCLGGPDPNNASAAVRHTIPLTSTGVLAVREWARAPQPLINFDALMQVQNKATGQFAIVVGDTQGAWDVSENSSASGLVDHPSLASPRTGVWMCVELDYTFDPTPAFELFVDDTSVLAIPAQDPSPAFDTAEAGIGRADELGEHLIVDDVVVASQHIGCH